MEIQPLFNECIWCGRPFAIRGFKVRTGEVVRSREHILPANIFGRIKTLDVCISCNSSFGSGVDDCLLNDGSIFTAGLAAGFKAGELLPDFRVNGVTPQGEPFEYRVRNGKWRLEPTFTDAGFKIGAVEGCSTTTDLENAKRKMLAVVLRKKPQGMTKAEVEKWVADLFTKFLDKHAKYKVFSRRLGQGLRARPIRARGKVTITTNPWETQWCVGKIAYEAGHVLVPSHLYRRIRGALSQLRSFLLARKERHGIFTHTSLNIPAQPVHEIEIAASGAKLRFRIRIFKREQWDVEFDVFRRDQPASLEDFKLLVVNQCLANAAPTVRIYENGVEQSQEYPEKP